jgi:hypothetical protein
MVAPGEKLEGAPAAPLPPVNPMANNVNMHPMDAAYGVGHAWRGDDPVGPGLGNGTQPTHA